MLAEYLRQDPILRRLVLRNHLTPVQVDVLLISRAYGAEEPLRLQARRRDRRLVTVGAFARSLRQAQVNLLRVLYTFLLGEYLGLWPAGIVRALTQIVETLGSSGRSQLGESVADEVMQRIDSALQELIQRSPESR